MTGVDVVSSVMFDIDELDWAELVPGVQAKRVWADPATKRAALFIRFSAGTNLARHEHDGDELVYVLEGSVADDFGAVTAGNVGYRPHGCAHTVRSPKGATALAVVSGGVKPVGEDVEGGPASLVYDLATTSWVELRPGVRQKPIWADTAAGAKCRPRPVRARDRAVRPPSRGRRAGLRDRGHARGRGRGPAPRRARSPTQRLRPHSANTRRGHGAGLPLGRRRGDLTFDEALLSDQPLSSRSNMTLARS